MPAEPVPTPSAPSSAGPSSPAVRAGDWLPPAGQGGIDPGTGKLADGGVAEQTRQAMANVAAVLGDCGASLGDVAKTTVFLVDMGDFPVMNEVYAEALAGHRPARAAVAVGGPPAGARGGG